MRRLPVFLSVWIVIFWASLNVSFAQVTTTWTGGVSSDWDDPANWDNGVPTAIDDAIINSASFNPVLNVAAAVNNLTTNGVASLTVNGQSLSVGGALTVTISNTNPDGLIMTNTNDLVTVEGAATFTTVVNHGSANSEGQFTAGLLRVRGDFTQTHDGSSGSQRSFVSTGTKVLLDGAGVQQVSFLDPGAAISRFKDLSIENTSPSTVIMNSPVVATGQLQSPQGVTSTLAGNGNALTVNGGLDVENLVLENVALTVNNGPFDRFNNVTFAEYPTTADQMTINHTALDALFAGLQFLTAPSTGHYIVANDTDGPATPATLTIANAAPTDGSPFTSASGGFNVVWTEQLVVIDDEADTQEDTPVSINVLDNDQDPSEGEGVLTVTAVMQGAGGSVVIDPGAMSVTYTPNLDFHGIDTFIYTADLDGQETDVGTVTVTVQPDGLEPVIVVTPAATDYGPIKVGAAVSRFVKVKNVGEDNLRVSDINTTGPFTVVSDSMFIVAPGDSVSVEVAFMPGAPSEATGDLTALSNDPVNPSVMAALSGIGISGGDLNRDGNINVLDIIAMVQTILGQRPMPDPGTEPHALADVNEDGDINVLDIVALVNIILNPPQTRPSASANTPVVIQLGAAQATEDGRRRVPVEAAFDGVVAGVQLTLTYDPAVLTVGAPEPTGWRA